MKSFRIYHKDGTPEVIEGNLIAAIKTKSGLQIKIGNRKIADAVALVEESPEIVFETSAKSNSDED